MPRKGRPPSKLDAPWPIRNAIACLEEVRDREQTRLDAGQDDDRAQTIVLAMEYAIETVKGINTMRQPAPPPLKAELRRTARLLAYGMAEALSMASDRLAQWGYGYSDYDDEE